MRRETMTAKERIQWHTKVIEEASKLGRVNRSILQRKWSVVEMLRLEANADPEGAAYAYMKLQERDQAIGGSLEKDNESMELSAAISGLTPASQAEFNAWFDDFCSTLGTGPFEGRGNIETEKKKCAFCGGTADKLHNRIPICTTCNDKSWAEAEEAGDLGIWGDYHVCKGEEGNEEDCWYCGARIEE